MTEVHPVGQPSPDYIPNCTTKTTKQFRNGMLWREEALDLLERNAWFNDHKELVEKADGHDDRFIQTLKRVRQGETHEDTISIHLFHMPDKVLIYICGKGSPSRLWVYQDGHEYLLGEIKQESFGLIIGDPMDDLMTRYPVEVPVSTVKQFEKDCYTHEWLESPSPKGL